VHRWAAEEGNIEVEIKELRRLWIDFLPNLFLKGSPGIAHRYETTCKLSHLSQV